MQNISIQMLIDDTQAKNFIIFDVMKIMIHLAWVANSMVTFSASYNTLFSLTKNLVYKNIEAQIWKKIRTIIRTLSASQ